MFCSHANISNEEKTVKSSSTHNNEQVTGGGSGGGLFPAVQMWLVVTSLQNTVKCFININLFAIFKSFVFWGDQSVTLYQT